MDTNHEIARLQGLLAAGAETQAELVGQLAAHPNPTVRMLAEMWSRRRDAEEAVPEEMPEEPPRPAIEPLDLDAFGLSGPLHGPAPRRRLTALELEVERLQAINETLAAALGACPVCWGDDPGCRVCHGRGGPGSRRPDRELFARLVTPALRRLRAPNQPHRLPIDDRATTERREG
jgi:hypothetical protein